MGHRAYSQSTFYLQLKKDLPETVPHWQPFKNEFKAFFREEIGVAHFVSVFLCPDVGLSGLPP